MGNFIYEVYEGPQADQVERLNKAEEGRDYLLIDNTRLITLNLTLAGHVELVTTWLILAGTILVALIGALAVGIAQGWIKIAGV